MLINGCRKDIPAGTALALLLQEQGYRLDRIVVELNGSIVQPAAYGSTLLSGTDRLEIVSFVGGG